MSTRPTKLDSTVLTAIGQLQDQVAGRGGPVMIGTRWRIRAAPWPTEASLECLFLEHLDAKGWRTLAVLKPDGVWGYDETTSP